jgi:hypothetical protein
MLIPLQISATLDTPVEKSKNPRPNDVRLILDAMNGFSAKIGSIVRLGRGYFTHQPRHFVPGYYRAVPPGPKDTRPPRLYLS